jgi:hypothetical protein
MMLHYQPLISFLLSDSGTDYHQLDPQSIRKCIQTNFGEKSWREFRRLTQITPVKILPVTPVKIPAAAGKAREEPSKTVGPAGDSLYQSQREEKKLMVDSEASSTSSTLLIVLAQVSNFTPLPQC